VVEKKAGDSPKRLDGDCRRLKTRGAFSIRHSAFNIRVDGGPR
jgi:hypothetical protein